MEVKVDGFTVGTVVSLQYKVDADTKQVVMNFLSGPGSADRIFHFNPRYHEEQALVLNTRKGVSGWPWGEEERPPGFPFEIDKEVHVTIEAQSDGFLIKCDGHSFQYKFNYRGMPITNIRHIVISYGTLRIEKASYLGIVNPQSNKSIKDGDSVTLSVSAIQSGQQPLSFKWKKYNGDLTDTSIYAGVDDYNLKISSFSAKEQGKYSCIVSNGRWSVESGSAELALARDTGISNGNGTPPVPAVQPDPVDATGTESTDPGIDRANEEEKYPASASPKAFSDALSPTDLVAWLSQQFQAKGLTLDTSLGQKLIDDHINGEAFMDLEDKDLTEIGFKKGQHMKVLKIIQSVKEEKEVISSDQNQSPSKPAQEPEAPGRTPVLSIATLTLLKGKGKEVEIIKAVTPNWTAFGQHLDFDPVGRDLEIIEKRNNKDPAESCKDMFKHWLNGNGVEATWDNVIDFLKAVGLKVLAKDVQAIIY